MKFKIQATPESINSSAGLVPAGRLIDHLEFDKTLDNTTVNETTLHDVPNSSCVRSYLGLLLEGRTAFDEIEARRSDKLFSDALDVPLVPSAATMRQRFDQAAGAFDEVLKGGNVRLLRSCDFGSVSTRRGELVPVDADVACQDNSNSHKEGVAPTYHHFDGFAPMFAYVGTEGFMLANELRPGDQHCQNGTPQFLQECVDRLEYIGACSTLFRLDGGNDAGENLRVLQGRADYIIKRNLRRESPSNWRETAREHGTEYNPREDKTVWHGSLWSTFPDRKGLNTPVRLVFEVTERRTDRAGTPLLYPDIEVQSWWTSLQHDSDNRVIELYRDRGTSEQFHSEFKTEVGLERLPSGKFATNSTVMQLGMLAYNILRRIGQDILQLPGKLPLRKEIARRRVRKVIQDVIRVACKYVRTSRQAILKLRSDWSYFEVFRQLHAVYS